MAESASTKFPRTVKVNAMGVECPIPVIRAKRALRGMRSGEILELTCTDPMANIDVPCLLFKTGDALMETTTSEGVITFRISKA